MINNMYPEASKELARQKHEHMLADSERSRLAASLKSGNRRAGRHLRSVAVAAALVLLMGALYVSVVLAAASGGGGGPYLAM